MMMMIRNIPLFNFYQLLLRYIVIGSCIVWMYIYILFGKVSYLQHYIYQPLLAWMNNNIDDKAMIIVITFTIPIVLIGTVLHTVVVVVDDNDMKHPSPTIHHHHYYDNNSRIYSWIANITNVHNTHYRIIPILLIYIPLVLYTITNIIQKLNTAIVSSSSSTTSSTRWYNNNDLLSSIGNIFGIIALYSLSVVVVPMTYQYYNNNNNNNNNQRNRRTSSCSTQQEQLLLVLHQTLGYCTIFGTIFHVFIHCYRYIQFYNHNHYYYYSLYYMIFVIPNVCYKEWWMDSMNSNNTDEIMITQEELCNLTNNNTIVLLSKSMIQVDCTCYGHIRNMVGTIGFIILVVVLGITSILYTIRKYYYTTIFYIIHIYSTPIIYITIVLHWNRSIIYLSSSILYYFVATIIPYWIDRYYYYYNNNITTSAMNQNKNTSSCSCSSSVLRITSIEHIHNNTTSSFTTTTTTSNQSNINSVTTNHNNDNNNNNENDHDRNNNIDHHHYVQHNSIIALSIVIDTPNTTTTTTIMDPISGQYCHLYTVPNILHTIINKSHPFTINPVIVNIHGSSSTNNNISNTCSTTITNKNNNSIRHVKNGLELRIIFRCVGPFTKELGQRLLDLNMSGSNTNITIRTINNIDDPISSLQKEQQQLQLYINNGLHGGVCYISMIENHDHLLFIAGGIGITPHLSVLYNIIVLVCNNNNNNNNNNNRSSSTSTSNDSPPQWNTHTKITFYWICNDDALIQYIRREYFDPIMEIYNNCDTTERVVTLKIFIHRTNGNTTSSTIRQGENSTQSFLLKPPTRTLSYTNLEQQELVADDVDDNMECNNIMIRPIISTPNEHLETERSQQYHNSDSTIMASNIFPLIRYILITYIGLYILWYCYIKYQQKDTVLSRLIAPVVVMIYGCIVSFVIHWITMNSSIIQRSCCFYRYEKRAIIYRKDSNQLVDDNNDYDIHVNQFIESKKSTMKDKGWTPIQTLNIDDDDHDDGGDSNYNDPLEFRLNKSSSVEMGLVHDDNVIPETSKVANETNISNDAAATSKSCIELLKGRPSIHEMLHHIDQNDSRPGVLVCGPSGLMLNIRRAINNRRQSNCCPTVTLYEESFEM